MNAYCLSIITYDNIFLNTNYYCVNIFTNISYIIVYIMKIKVNNSWVIVIFFSHEVQGYR